MTQENFVLRPEYVTRAVGGLALALVLASSPSAEAQTLSAGAPATKFTAETFAIGVTTPTDIALLPDGRALILEKVGSIVIRNPDETTKSLSVADLKWPGTIDTSSEKGLLGVVLDPNFAATKRLYFYVSLGDENNRNKIVRGTISDNNTITIDKTPILDKGIRGPANHDGGGMVIYKNHLYVGVGDTGLNQTPPQNRFAACLNVPNGKVLRINLDGTTPANNPLVGVDKATGCTTAIGATFTMETPDDRIFLWGTRNPWRIWIDEKTDLMWVADVGEGEQEDVHVVGPLAGLKGASLGWPFEEGTTNFKGASGWNLKTCAEMSPSVPCQPPAFTYPHKGEAPQNKASITGGLIPSGCGWAESGYGDKYFFGDHESDNIYTIDVTPDHKGVATPPARTVFATVGGGMSSFREGPDGALYVTVDEKNAVVRIAPKTRPASCANGPTAGASGAAGATGGAAGATGGAGTSGGAAGTSGGAAGAAAGKSGSPAGTSGSVAGKTGSTAGTTGSSPADAGAKASSDGGGCGCQTGARAGGSAALGLVTAAALLLGRRRRRS